MKITINLHFLLIAAAFLGCNRSEMTLEKLLMETSLALGDPAAIEKLHSVEIDGVYSEKDYSFNMQFRQMKPYCVHVKITDDEGNSLYEEGYDGESAWEFTPQDSTRREVTGRPKEALHRTTQRMGPMNPLKNLINEGHDYDFKGMVVLNEMNYYRVDLISEGETTEVYFDVATLRPAIRRQIVRQHAYEEQPQPIESVFSDYRYVDGIWFNFKTSERNFETGAILSEMTVREVKTNLPFREEQFGLEER